MRQKISSYWLQNIKIWSPKWHSKFYADSRCLGWQLITFTVNASWTTTATNRPQISDKPFSSLMARKWDELEVVRLAGAPAAAARPSRPAAPLAPALALPARLDGYGGSGIDGTSDAAAAAAAWGRCWACSYTQLHVCHWCCKKDGAID